MIIVVSLRDCEGSKKLYWEDYEGFSCKYVSTNGRIVNLFTVGKGKDAILTEHLSVDKEGKITHITLHGFDRKDFVNEYKAEFCSRCLNFMYK